MKITNPTKEYIKNIKIGENIYSIEPEGVLENVPESDARYWQENLHKFLILRKDKLEDVKTATVEIPTPKVEEAVAEEEVAPVVEEEVIKAPIVKETKINKKK